MTEQSEDYDTNRSKTPHDSDPDDDTMIGHEDFGFTKDAGVETCFQKICLMDLRQLPYVLSEIEEQGLQMAVALKPVIAVPENTGGTR
jgi:hypothetical protein